MSVTGLSGLMQTLVSGVTEACQVLKPTWAMQDAIYWDHNPLEPAALGQTLNIALPTDPSASVQDIQSNDMVLNEAGFTTPAITLNRHPEYSFPVRDYDQFKTPLQIRNAFADAALTGIHNFINNDVCQLATSTNFATNTPITCTGSAITTTQFTGALAVLANQRVPVENNPKDVTVLLPPAVYYNLTDPATGTAGAAWTQAFIAGNRFAEEVRTTGQIPVAFGTSFRLDQQMPVSGSSPSQTFTGILMHRWAVAGITRPIKAEAVSDKVVETAYLPFGRMTLRVMVGYSFFPKKATIMSIDCVYGLKVVRPEMAVLFSIAQ